MEAWIKPTKPSGTMAIIKKTGIVGGGTGYELYCGSAGYLYCRFNGLDASRAVSTTKYPTDGTWMHVAATYDGTSTKMYVNGVLEATTAYTAAIVNSANKLAIATDLSTTLKLFQGSIDEVRLWNVVRSDADIKASMTKKLVGNESGLVGYWRFDETSGIWMKDETSNHSDGTMTNMDPATDHVWSGAALGDASAYDYVAAGGYTATVSHANGDAFTATTTSGTISGIQVYRADDNALRTGSTGLAGYTLDPSRFWGVRAIGTATPTYTLVYNYTGNPSVKTETGLKLVKRNDISVAAWSDASATLNATDNTLTVTGATGTEYALAIPLPASHTISASAGANGTISPSGAVSVTFGANQTFTFSPSTGYHVADVLVDGVSQGSPPSYTFTNVTDNHSISVSFDINAYTLSSSAGTNGSISPLGDVVVNYGSNQKFTITPAPGYVVDGVFIDGGKVDSTISYTFLSVAANHTILANFKTAPNLPPESPTLISPSNGASGVSMSPTLNVSVNDPNSDPMTATFFGKPASGSTGENFTIIDLPDAQNYSTSSSGNGIFKAQTRWIVNQRAIRNIVYVTQVGDIVEDGDAIPIEWYRVDTAMTFLEDPLTTGLPEGIPYGVCVGNHDQTPKDDPNGTTTYYNQYFGSGHFAGKSYYGGHYGSNNDNSFQLFSASGMDFIVVDFEYNSSPDPTLLHWADTLLKSHSNRRAIVCTHYLMDGGNPGSFSSQGSVIYDSLKDNPNLFLMLGGHTGPEGRRSDTYNGHTVYSLLADYQGEPNGGDGWLRIMEFSPSTSQILVTTYSPTLDQNNTGSSSQFTLSYAMDVSSYQALGTNINVPSGTSTSIGWPGLAPLTQYDWYVTLDDGHNVTTGPTWTFTTQNTQYIITASADANGTISPNGAVSVTRGANQHFVITSNTGYHLDSLLVDEALSDSSASFTFKNVVSAHTIRAVFKANSTTMSTIANAGWNLVSVPLQQVDMTPAGVFGDDYGATLYYVFGYDISSGYSAPSVLTMGGGYWLGSGSSQTIDAEGTAPGTVSHALTEGYNIIGDPFPIDELKSSLQFTYSSQTKGWADAVSAGWLSNVLWSYGGAGYTSGATTLSVWKGYWIPMLANGATIQHTPPGGSATPKVAEPDVELTTSTHWSVDLAATLVTTDGTVCTDEVASFGVRSDATREFENQYDAPRPPRGPAKEYIELSFPVKGESYPKIFGSSYARDYTAAEKPEWEFAVNTSQEGTVTLKWDKSAISTLGSDVKINLYDVTAHKVIDMKDVDTYTYEQTRTSRQFTVNKVEQAIPTLFQLVQNYPNPFNPTTVISYGVPQAEHVKLEVYNMLGEKVSTLVNEPQEAGYYSVSWNGHDQTDRSVTSGVYVYRLTAGEYTSVKKMLLLK